MLIITDKQRKLLLEYLLELEQAVLDEDLEMIFDKLDDKILDIGLDDNYDINKVGLKLQRLYDEIYVQNLDDE